MNLKKTLNILIIACLIWNCSFPAEGISVKLRGKLALVGILSGVAYLTHTLVKRDRHAAEELKSQLGQAEHIIQIERGFDKWEIHHFPEQAYYFLNNRIIRKKAANAFSLNQTFHNTVQWNLLPYHTSNRNRSVSSVLTDTTFLVNPRWLSLYPLRQLLIPQSATPYLHRLEREHWLGQDSLRSYLMLQK